MSSFEIQCHSKAMIQDGLMSRDFGILGFQLDNEG